ncbi:MAG: hypothetical protein APR63_10160 [Desulfuromonas sp. SDB]|nr:MAG: hypothetical protein APR63_10160 [Desulfuromonas sp. SDB]
MFAALTGFSFSYFQQIIQSAYRGEDKPPLWEIQEISLMSWIHAVIPLMFTFFQSLVITCILVFFVAVIYSSTFMAYFYKLGKILFPFIFACIFPVNFLGYSLFKDMNILKILAELDFKSKLLLFSFFPIFLLGIILILFIPIDQELLNLLVKWILIFYLMQVFSHSIAKLPLNNQLK